MAAQFRIDQVTPGAGTLDRSRNDLIPGEIISLVVSSPVVGAAYTWEIVDKAGSTAVLSSASGTTVSIGLAGTIVAFCAFLVELTETIGSTVTRQRRKAAVPGAVTGLVPLLFGERANSRAKRSAKDADASTDNAVYSDLAGVTGDNEQNWRGYAEQLFRAVRFVEQSLSGSGGMLQSQFAAATGGEFVTTDTFDVLVTQNITVADDGNYLLIDATCNVELGGTGTDVVFRIQVDGSEVRTGTVTTSGNTGKPVQISFSERYSVPSAGLVVVTFEWAVELAGDTATNNFATLRIFESAV